jgi:hypothetical protein
MPELAISTTVRYIVGPDTNREQLTYCEYQLLLIRGLNGSVMRIFCRAGYRIAK